MCSLRGRSSLSCEYLGKLPSKCRSVGDGDLKSSGLTACPEVDTYELSREETFLIIASDGLWDKLSSQDAVDLVHDTVKDPAMCAQRLTTEALTRGSGRLLL